MKVVKEKTDVGIIVGRFQVPDLHEAHVNLIQSVCDEHDKVIVFLGLAKVYSSENPLDFEARKHMIAEAFPNVIIAYLPDTKHDAVWSQKLDEQIGHLTGAKQTITLYGSRDSFIKHYSGRYINNVTELVQEHWISGTTIRQMVKNQVKSTRDFRHGAIWESWQRFDTAYPTVDMAVITNDLIKVVLVRKEFETTWGFPGGFTDPTDKSYEAAANRELREEVPNIEFDVIKPIHYKGSVSIDDWRYRGCNDQIITHFYVTTYQSGYPSAADDIAEAKWFNIAEVNVDRDISDTHRPLWEKLMDHIQDVKITRGVK